MSSIDADGRTWISDPRELKDLEPGDYILSGPAADEALKQYMKQTVDWMGPEPTDHRRFVSGERVRDDNLGEGAMVIRTEDRNGIVHVSFGQGSYYQRHYSKLHRGRYTWADEDSA